jgi:hypothetical protein
MSNDWTFVTKEVDVEFSNLQAEVTWTADIEVRDWGVKYMFPIIERVVIHGESEEGEPLEKIYEGDNVNAEYDPYCDREDVTLVPREVVISDGVAKVMY